MKQSTAEQLFLGARSFNAWASDPVPEPVLRELYELVRYGPTSANCSPLRIVFVASDERRRRLADLMVARNAGKVLEAPVTAILAYDRFFYEQMPKLFPHNPQMAEMFINDPHRAAETAFRNSSLQGGYFILAARLLGLDCGPMSGFDATGVNAAFFPDGRFEVNFVCSLGRGDPARELWDRLPRLTFEEACTIQ